MCIFLGTRQACAGRVGGTYTDFCSPTGELLQWLEQRQLLHALVADSGPALDLQLPHPVPQRQRRSQATSAVHRCCTTGCTQQDLQDLCPH